MSDKYKLFKQFMHNELGISREDIREWIREACKEEAHKVVSNAFDNFNMDVVIKKTVFDERYYPRGFQENIKERVVKELCKTIEVTFEKK